jgi:hypothetical protein
MRTFEPRIYDQDLAVRTVAHLARQVDVIGFCSQDLDHERTKASNAQKCSVSS